MHLITAEELRPRESILTSDATPNTLQIRDPQRFPFIAELVETMMTRDLKNGYLYRYLAIRFAGHGNCTGWRHIYSFGPAGDQMEALLDEFANIDPDSEVCKRLEQLPGRWPLRERVVLAWLRRELPAGLLSAPNPTEKRLFSTYNSRFRRMFRPKKP